MLFNKTIEFLKILHVESIIWLGALIYLFVINPYSTNHFSFCLFKFLGLDFCPGCGLGLSISYLLHLDITNSLHSHYLGIPALVILVHRIYVLIKLDLTELKISKYFINKELLND